MPKLTNSVPKYRKHRASGQAVVTLNGRDHYLGPHGTKASRIEYDRKRPPAPSSLDAGISSGLPAGLAAGLFAVGFVAAFFFAVLADGFGVGLAPNVGA